MRKDAAVVLLILSALASIADLRSVRSGSWQYLSDLTDAIGRVSEDLIEEDEYSGENTKREEERAKLSAQLPQNGDLFEEDMVMDDRLREIVLDGVDGRKRSAEVHRTLSWQFDVPNQAVIIPYVIDPNFLHGRYDENTGKVDGLLGKAMEEYHTRTCIRFEYRTNQEGYVRFNSDKNTCSSNVGRVGPRMQNVTIGANCNVIGTVLHEMEHVLGIIHEHSRPDRDTYVDVKWENIKKDDKSNFKKYKTTQVRWEDVPYNFNSVMHYRNDAFTTNGQDTLTALGDPNMNFGQRDQWSQGDAKTVNKLYCMHENVQRDYSTNNLYRGLMHDTSGLERKKDRAAEEQRYYDSHYNRNNDEDRNNEERAKIIPAWK